jgi:hypothetical protein
MLLSTIIWCAQWRKYKSHALCCETQVLQERTIIFMLLICMAVVHTLLAGRIVTDLLSHSSPFLSVSSLYLVCVLSVSSLCLVWHRQKVCVLFASFLCPFYLVCYRTCVLSVSVSYPCLVCVLSVSCLYLVCV